MEEQKKVNNKGGTMRLGAYECKLNLKYQSFSNYKKNLHLKDTDTALSSTTNTWSCLKKMA
jgi:CTP synthase (UTP-ammonia lyase)